MALLSLPTQGHNNTAYGHIYCHNPIFDYFILIIIIIILFTEKDKKNDDDDEKTSKMK
jgi:uncharacterized membrane protein